MKRLLFSAAIFLCFEQANGQIQLTKKLYFAGDSTFYIGCGVMENASELYFVSDSAGKTTNKNLYNIVIVCPELYGNDFFKKGARYKLALSKNYTKIGSYFSTDIFMHMRRSKNLYFCENIEVD